MSTVLRREESYTQTLTYGPIQFIHNPFHDLPFVFSVISGMELTSKDTEFLTNNVINFLYYFSKNVTNDIVLSVN